MKNVLVVDDSKSIRSEVAEILQRAGFGVIEAIDGTEALACLLGQNNIVLVVLDVNMPGMNGLDVLERIRAQQRNHSLPVLMLTTEAERTLVERAKKAGAMGWLLKPINAALLVNTVSRLSL